MASRPSLESLLRQAAAVAGLPALPSVQPAPVVEIGPGDSIQAAVDAAAPGTVIVLDPGTYAQAVTVSRPGIFIAGRGGPGAVVITNPGGADNGVHVEPGGDGFGLVGVSVEGFGSNGVILEGVRGFTLLDVAASDDGDYGLFPVLSSLGLVAGCTAAGNRDTGVYVGQSMGVAVLGNVARGNVNGFEVENSVGTLVAGNAALDNTLGVLVDLLPGLNFPFSFGTAVAGNLVAANNHANFGSPSDITSLEPPGVGVFVLGADGTAVADNFVLGNQTIGVGVGSSLVLNVLGGISMAGIQPLPIGNRVQGNAVAGAGADLLWDGLGVANCWSDNAFRTSLSPQPLPACGHGSRNN
jgi:parallel beta-helix repeat protein